MKDKIDEYITNLVSFILSQAETPPAFINGGRVIDGKIIDSISNMTLCFCELVSHEILSIKDVEELANNYYLDSYKVHMCEYIERHQKDLISQLMDERAAFYVSYSFENELYETIENFTRFQEKLNNKIHAN